MLNWVKKHKGIVILAAAILLVGAGILTVRAKAQEAMKAMTELAEETAFVEKRSIQSSISSTGKIISDTTRSISASVSGLEVLTVNVEVGDVVNEGDIICTFDMADVEESLDEAEDMLNAAKKQSQNTVNNAKRALEMAIETQNYQVENAARNVINAYDSYCSAADAYDEAEDSLGDAKKAADEALKKCEELSAAYSAAGSDVDALQQAYQAALDSYNAMLPDYNAKIAEYDGVINSAEATEEAKAQAQTAKTDLQAQHDAALKAVEDAAAALTLGEASFNKEGLSAQYSAAQANYAAAQKTYETLKTNLSSMEKALDSAKNAYISAQSAYDYTVASQLSQYEGSRDSLSTAKASASVSTISQENAVEAYEKQLENGVLTASIGGTVTAVNVHEGDMYAGGAVVTIQDCGDLMVSAEIDEYDIADIALGMKAVFKTDATREEMLEGEVVFISPTPTVGSDVTYQVKVKITTPTDRLRLGMNAKLNIILAETGSVLTVPYDAVQQDENGNDVVYVVERSESGVIRTAVPVTVGVEGDYYVEIQGSIAEGAEISLPADQSTVFEQMIEMRDSMMGMG